MRWDVGQVGWFESCCTNTSNIHGCGFLCLLFLALGISSDFSLRFLCLLSSELQCGTCWDSVHENQGTEEQGTPQRVLRKVEQVKVAPTDTHPSTPLAVRLQPQEDPLNAHPASGLLFCLEKSLFYQRSFFSPLESFSMLLLV